MYVAVAVLYKWLGCQRTQRGHEPASASATGCEGVREPILLSNLDPWNRLARVQCNGWECAVRSRLTFCVHQLSCLSCTAASDALMCFIFSVNISSSCCHHTGRSSTARARPAVSLLHSAAVPPPGSLTLVLDRQHTSRNAHSLSAKVARVKASHCQGGDQGAAPKTRSNRPTYTHLGLHLAEAIRCVQLTAAGRSARAAVTRPVHDPSSKRGGEAELLLYWCQQHHRRDGAKGCPLSVVL